MDFGQNWVGMQIVFLIAQMSLKTRGRPIWGGSGETRPILTHELNARILGNKKSQTTPPASTLQLRYSHYSTHYTVCYYSVHAT